MDDMDRLLDSALRDYVEREAPLGMESRVLRRVAERRKPGRRWLWALVPAGVAGLAAAFWVTSTPAPSTQERPAQTVAAANPPAAPAPETPVPARRLKRRRSAAAAPEPPTQQQLALAAFAANYPEQAVQALQRPAAELTITPLKIEPLEIPSLGDN
jgi:hypothetical protein